MILLLICRIQFAFFRLENDLGEIETSSNFIASFYLKEEIFQWLKFALYVGLSKQASKGKSAYEPNGPAGRSLSSFLLHEATRNISTPGWDAIPSQGYVPAYNLPVPI